MIERGSGVAVWRQIENELADAIAQGSLAAGERLPNEMQLAEQFAVNRHTIRAVQWRHWWNVACCGWSRGAARSCRTMPLTMPSAGARAAQHARQNLDASIEIISSDTLPATVELAGSGAAACCTASGPCTRTGGWWIPAGDFSRPDGCRGLPTSMPKRNRSPRTLARLGVGITPGALPV